MPATIASSGRLCSSWKFELHSTSRFCASHTTKASGIVSMASRSRRSASAVFSTSVFCSVTSTAIPIRCGPLSSGCCTSSQRARSHTHLPPAWRMRKAWSIEGRLGVGELGRELVELQIVGVHERVDLAEAHQIVARLEAEDREHRMRPEDAAARDVPVPQPAAAAVERGVDARAHGLVDQVGFARARRLPMEGEAEDQHHEAGGGRERDRQRGVGAPGGERVGARLHDGELAGVEMCARWQRPACRRRA